MCKTAQQSTRNRKMIDAFGAFDCNRLDNPPPPETLGVFTVEQPRVAGEASTSADPLSQMSHSRRGSRVRQSRPCLDREVAAMIDRVRQVFGDEILAGIYVRAQNAAIRRARALNTPASAPSDARLRLVSDDDGFVRALRDELDRALTHH